MQHTPQQTIAEILANLPSPVNSQAPAAPAAENWEAAWDAVDLDSEARPIPPGKYLLAVAGGGRAVDPEGRPYYGLSLAIQDPGPFARRRLRHRCYLSPDPERMRYTRLDLAAVGLVDRAALAGPPPLGALVEAEVICGDRDPAHRYVRRLRAVAPPASIDLSPAPVPPPPAAFVVAPPPPPVTHTEAPRQDPPEIPAAVLEALEAARVAHPALAISARVGALGGGADIRVDRGDGVVTGCTIFREDPVGAGAKITKACTAALAAPSRAYDPRADLAAARALAAEMQAAREAAGGAA